MGNKSNASNESNSIYLWKEIIDRLSKEFNMTWQAVTQMNIYTFNDRCKFIELKVKKELINTKKYANKSTRSRHRS